MRYQDDETVITIGMSNNEICELYNNLELSISDREPRSSEPDALLMLLPLLIVLSTMLFVLLLFLICVLLLRKRRGISLRDYEGPVDVSREDLIDADGGIAGIEERWLEQAPEDLRRTYRQAKRALSSAFRSAELGNILNFT